MTALNQNRYDQLLRRVGDLKGPGSKVNDALTELFPMIDVENVPPELALLSGNRLAMGTRVEAAGGAGFFSTIILRNPGGTGAIIRVTLVSIHVSTGGGNAVLGPTLNSFTAGGQRAFSDGRVFGEGTVGVIQRANNLLTTGSSFFRVRDDGTGKILAPPDGIAVLSPGTALQVSAESANTAITVSFMWMERTAQPSELNL